MKRFPGRVLADTYCRLLIAASFCLFAPMSASAQDATSDQRPLGILIQGSGATTAPQATSTGSVLPQNVFSSSATRAASPAPPTTSQLEDRPLGTLFAPDALTTKARSVLPGNWNRQASPSTSTRAAATVTPSERPLGTLFNAGPTSPLPAAEVEIRPPVVGETERRAQRVQPSIGSDASSDKPLGTLFGTEPQINRNATVAGSPLAAPLAPQSSAPSVRTSSEDPVRANLAADNLSYDQDRGLIVASGNVEITYENRTLRAQEVTYNQNTDVVTASGNVLLKDEGEELLLGERMEVTGDLRDGLIYSIGLVLADKSRVAGSGARRSDGSVTELRNAVYSPCNLCPDNPDAAPLWQVKAVKVVHDENDKTVTYQNAWFEIFGTPVFYTPYLQHPDPTVRRKSGFLFPSLTSSSDLGFRAETPYYWAIDEFQDATFSPLITTDGGSGGYAEYRRNFEKGELRSEGSFVFDDPDEDFRGFIDIESMFHLDPTWRAGLDVEAATDDTYMRRYGFAAEPVLISRAYAEGFRGRNYQVLNAYAFQDTRADADDDTTPLVLPMYDYNYVSRNRYFGGTASFDFNALSLMRQEGTDTRRISFRPRWDRQFTGIFSDLFEASASIAMDGYHATDVERSNGDTYTGISGRIVPKASLTWRRPMLRAGTKYNQTIEPIIGVTLSPNGGNSDKTPNEDSQQVEFDETNLFRENRFDGLDRIDGGSRVNYGLNWVLTDEDDRGLSAFIGQSFRPHTDDTFQTGSGLEDNFSDIVGSLHLRPSATVDLSYRTQIDYDGFSTRRDEVTATLGGEALRMNANYAFFDRTEGSEFDGREEITGSLTSQFNRYWQGSLSSRYDIADADLRSVGLNLVYEDECLKLTTNFSRTFFRDRDIEPTDAVTFTLVLKTLGEVTNSLDVN